MPNKKPNIRKPRPEPEITLVSDDIFTGSGVENALTLLITNGYKDAIIPEPVSSNVLSDRIYFLVPVGKKLRPRTAFIIAALDPNSIELEIYRGWQIENPCPR